MFLKRWFRQRRFAKDRERLEAAGLWGDTIHTLTHYVEHLERVTIPAKIDLMERLIIRSHEPNLDRLLFKFERDTRLIEQEDYLPTELLRDVQKYTMESFLVTVANVPITVPIASQKLLDDVQTYLTAMQMLISQETAGTRVSYYERRSSIYYVPLRDLLYGLAVLAGLEPIPSQRMH